MLDQDLMTAGGQPATTEELPPQTPKRSEPGGSTARRTLRDLFRWHAPRVGWCTLGGLATGIAYLLTTEPSYTARARVHVPLPTPRAEIAAALNTTAAPINLDNYLETQAQLIGSDSILKHTGEHLSGGAKLKTIQKSNCDGVEEYLRKFLDVEVSKNAEIIDISVNGVREREAIALVNAVTSAYIRHHGTESRSVAGDLLRTLSEHKSSIASQMATVQAAIDEYKRDNPNFSIEVAIAMIKNKLQVLSEQQTRCQLAAFQAQQSFAPEHPERVKALKLEVEASNAIKLAQDEAMRLNAQLADYQALETQLEQHKLAAKQMDARIANLELQRDADAARIGVAVIEPARVIHSSLSSMPLSTTGVFMLAGTLFGIAWSIQRDGSDRRLRCADDVHQAIGTGTPVLGVVPLMPKRRSHIGKAMATHLDPRGSAAEAHRTVRTSLLTTPGARRTILVTSPRPGDGKSVCATNLALSLIQAGRTVVLVDADLRRPTQHTNLDLQNGTGLAGAIRSSASLRFAIQPTGIDNFDVLTAGATSDHPSELFASTEFRALLTELGAQYDHVVIDSPPVNVVNDAALITSCCDATVLVLRAEQTTRTDATKALDMLTKMGGHVAGIVVNAAPAGENFGVYNGSYFATVDTTLRNQPSEAVAPKPGRDRFGLPSQLQPV